MPRGIGVLRNQLQRDRVRLVLSLTLLVLDDAALDVEPGLVHGANEMSHPVRLNPQGDIQRVGRNILEEVGAVFARRAVQIRRADPFHRPKKPADARRP